MTTTQKATTPTSYWTARNGQTACAKHLCRSYEAEAELKRHPQARRIETTITTWERMTKAEYDEFASLLAEYGDTEVCETCRHQAVTA